MTGPGALVLAASLAVAASAAATPSIRTRCRAEAVALRNAPGHRIWPAAEIALRDGEDRDRVLFPRLAEGTLLGVLEVAGPARDARGQPIAPGEYSLRYALQPPLKDHLDTTPHRDFAVLLPSTADDGRDWRAEALVAAARLHAGGHPLVLELRPAEDASAPNGITLRWPELAIRVVIP